MLLLIKTGRYSFLFTFQLLKCCTSWEKNSFFDNELKSSPARLALRVVNIFERFNPLRRKRDKGRLRKKMQKGDGL
jgi:hypothetical protein